MSVTSQDTAILQRMEHIDLPRRRHFSEMLGSVVEKQVSKVAPMMVANKGGFPPMSKHVKLQKPAPKTMSDRAQTDLSAPTLCDNKSVAFEAKDDPVVAASLVTEEISAEALSDNTTTVLAMSEEERAHALEEIQSFLSPKSIEFLQKASRLSSKDADVKEVVHKPPPQSKPLPVRDDTGAPSNEWLKQQTLETELRPFLGVHTHATMISERFDLNGRRIVDLLGIEAKVQEDVTRSGLFAPQLENSPNQQLNEAIAKALYTIVADAVLPLSDAAEGNPFFVPHAAALSAAEHQPQDELKHHQYEQGAPGYNMVEISEMFRSEFAHQRMLATRMLCGILLRRECVVALEAYSQECSGSDPEAALLVEDELGHQSAVFMKLSACFESALTGFVRHVDADPVTGHLVFREQPLEVSSAAAEPAVSRAGKPLRKLLTWCFLHFLAASDLPVELPTLFLWALSSSHSQQGDSDLESDGADSLELPMSFGSAAPRNNPAIAKVSLLRCLQLYLRSPVEDACLDRLQRRGVLWGAYGLPRLPTPHTRRTDSSYEQYMHDCAARAKEFLRAEEDDGADENGENESQNKRRTPESVREAFALQCRWSRIDAVVSRGSLVSVLAAHAEVAVEAAVAVAASKAPSSGSNGVLQACGTLSMDLLLALVRQGEEQVVEIVHRKFLVRTWRRFVFLVDSTREAEVQSGAAALRRQWFSVLAALVNRSRPAAQFLFEMNGEWVYSALLTALVRPAEPVESKSMTLESDAALALRMLSAGLVYGWGLHSVAELLLADQVSEAATLDRPGQTRSLCSEGGVPLFALLEQAAVACSLVFAASEEQGAHEATQTSSCLLAFVKRNWMWIEKTIFTSESYRLRSAILSFLCAVFPNPSMPSDRPDASPLDDMASEIATRVSVRGKGLVASIWDFTERLVRAAEGQQGGGSVTATALHLRGQSQDLLHFVTSQASFAEQTLSAYTDALVRAAVPPRFTSRWMQRCEHALHLQRFIALVAHAQIHQSAPTDPATLHRIASSSAAMMDACCTIMGTPFQLSLLGDQSPMPPKSFHADALESGVVSSGLMMWHVQRIQQTGLIVQAQFAASMLNMRISDAPFAQEVGDALVRLLSTHLVHLSAHSLSGALETLFGSFLKYNLLTCGAADDISTSKESQVALSADVFQKVLGVPMHSPQGSTSDVLAGLPPHKHATEWLDLRSTSDEAATGRVLALQPNWAFRVLGGDIADCSLAAWLRVLDNLTSTARASGNATELSEQLYQLMKLSTSDQAPKWYKAANAEDGGLIGCHPSAVAAYRRLVSRVLLQGLAQQNTPFMMEFCAVVAKDFFSTTGMVSKFLRKGKASASTRPGRDAKVSLEGVLDLCDKALDAALNQAVDSEVHSAVLIVLASPCMPWVVRQRVWSAVSAVRLVHLLEDRAFSETIMPALLRPQRLPAFSSPQVRSSLSSESLGLYTAVVDALTHLRADSDLSWSIVGISVFQVARYIFIEDSDGRDQIKSVVNGQAAHLLADLFRAAKAEGAEACWLLQAALDMPAMVPHTAAGESTAGGHSEVLNAILATCAQSCCGHSCVSDVIVPPLLQSVVIECASATKCLIPAFSASYC